jgi:hypothetical protein
MGSSTVDYLAILKTLRQHGVDFKSCTAHRWRLLTSIWSLPARTRARRVHRDKKRRDVRATRQGRDIVMGVYPMLLDET